MSDVATQTHTPAAGQVPPGRQSLWLLRKGERVRLSENFTAGELACRCTDPRCHLTLVSPRLVDALQTLRALIAAPLWITSGYRCLSHNALVGGRQHSFHTMGLAADIATAPPASLTELAESAARIPAVGGIGLYRQRGFVHVDVRPRTPAQPPTRWSA